MASKAPAVDAKVDTKTQDKPALDPAITKEPSALATTGGRPTSVAGYDVKDVGTGFEDFDQNDLAVPFLAILQKGNPQVEDENPKRIAGAKAGMLMDTVTNELYDGKIGVTVVPVHRTRTFLEWIPRDDGGGLVNVYQPDDPAVLAVLAKAGRKFGKLKINDNNDLVETFNVFCLLGLASGLTKRIVLGFSSSQIGMYKKWMTKAQSIQIVTDGRPVVPPMFSHRYRMTTQFFQKKENTWYKWVANFDGPDAESCRLKDTDPLCEDAKQFRALLLSGAATANFDSAVQDAHEEAEGFEM
jgi:hypothetical protein